MISTKPRAIPKLQILVLAAGFSRRLGRQKALARVRGITLLRRTLALLAPLSAAPLLGIVPPRAARYRAEVRGLNTRLIPNPQRAGGLSTSLRLGVRSGRYASALLVVPVDLAHLRVRDMRDLIRRWLGARRRIVATNAGGRAVSPLILPKRFFSAARNAAGDSGLRDFIAQLPAEAVVRIELPSVLLDVDTPADLHRARRRASG